MILFIEKNDGKEDDKIQFDKILAFDKKTEKWYIEDASVHRIFEKQGMQRKIIALRHNHKSTQRREYEYLQPYTRIKVMEVKGHKSWQQVVVVIPKTVEIPKVNVLVQNWLIVNTFWQEKSFIGGMVLKLFL